MVKVNAGIHCTNQRLWSIPDTAHLELRSNLSLGGTIPSELGSCSRLTVVGLKRTRITGTLPLELASLSNLEDFYISCTSITEPFPNGICGHRTNIYTDLSELHEGSECECCLPPTQSCDQKRIWWMDRSKMRVHTTYRTCVAKQSEDASLLAQST